MAKQLDLNDRMIQKRSDNGSWTGDRYAGADTITANAPRRHSTSGRNPPRRSRFSSISSGTYVSSRDHAASRPRAFAGEYARRRCASHASRWADRSAWSSAGAQSTMISRPRARSLARMRR